MVSTISPDQIYAVIMALITLFSTIAAIIKNQEANIQRDKVVEVCKVSDSNQEWALHEKNRRVKAEKELVDAKISANIPAASNPIVTRAMEKAESNGVPGISEDEAGDFYRAIIADPETGPALRAASEAWLKRHNK